MRLCYIVPAMYGTSRVSELGVSQEKLMAEDGKEAIKADDRVVSSAEVRALEKRIRELERVLGKKTLENEILREAVKVEYKNN